MEEERRQTDSFVLRERRFAEEGIQRNRGKEPATMPGERQEWSGPPGVGYARLRGLLIGRSPRLSVRLRSYELYERRLNWLPSYYYVVV